MIVQATRRCLQTSRHASECTIVRPANLSANASKRMMSWQGHGTDLLSDSLAHSRIGLPKIVLNAHGKSGFDVSNLVKNMDPSDSELTESGGLVHLCGSIFAFPEACFLWNVRQPEDVTLDSLSVVQVYKPTLEYLFLGSDRPIAPEVLNGLKTVFSEVGENGIVVEQMDLTNAMGTFNILNGEDRMVAAALILEPQDE